MYMLPGPSATFDERLIQRSGSGETDNTSNTVESGLVTPQDERDVPLLGLLGLKQAVEVIDRDVIRSGSSEIGKGDGVNYNTTSNVVSVSEQRDCRQVLMGYLGAGSRSVEDDTFYFRV